MDSTCILSAWSPALITGATYSSTGTIDTAPYSAKDYLVVLTATIDGVTETLSGTYLRVEGAPTAASLASPSNESDVLTFTPILIVNNASDLNDDQLTYEFEVYADSGLAQLITASGVSSLESGVRSRNEFVDRSGRTRGKPDLLLTRQGL